MDKPRLVRDDEDPQPDKTSAGGEPKKGPHPYLVVSKLTTIERAAREARELSAHALELRDQAKAPQLAIPNGANTALLDAAGKNMSVRAARSATQMARDAAPTQEDYRRAAIVADQAARQALSVCIQTAMELAEAFGAIERQEEPVTAG